MTSPFERRASEQIPSVSGFLAHVAPAPLEVYFQEKGENDTLYDRLVVITGSPGSGKTTISRLFGFETLFYLQRNFEQSALGAIYTQMAKCEALDGDFPLIAGTRLSMEINYRDFWECPYNETVRHKLMRALINARAVLGWCREFADAEIPLENIRAVYRADTQAGAEAAGGTNLQDMRERAAAVEKATYRIATALIAPSLDSVSAILEEGYEPLQFLSAFIVTSQGREYRLRPLVMLDDVHALHIEQRNAVLHWLVRRDIAVARWILWRFDALDPNHVLNDDAIRTDMGTPDPEPGLQVAREITEIRLQNERQNGRTQFRKMAQQMGKLYLNQMSVFKAVGIESLDEMLERRMTDIAPSVLAKIETRRQQVVRRASLPPESQVQIDQDVDDYVARRGLEASEAAAVREGMITILTARAARRTPQTSIFDAEPTTEESTAVFPKAKNDIEQGARLQLAQTFGIPYYYGTDALYDAGSQNAEQFLRLAAPMVRLLEVKTVRRRDSILTAREQDKSLREEAERIVSSWNFPEFHAVKRLVERISDDCVARSMEDTAPLGPGASGIGIPMEEFVTIAEKHPDFARVLQFGVAYNAFSLQLNSSAKGKLWCLIELGGAALVRRGLCFHKSKFVERRLRDALDYIKEPAA